MKVNEEKVREKVVELAKMYNVNVLSVARSEFKKNLILVICDYSVGFMFLYDLKMVFEMSDLEVIGIKTGVEVVMEVKSDKYFE